MASYEFETYAAAVPELPEAETIARSLHDALTGRRLGTPILERADIVRHAEAPLETLARRRVVMVSRRGKRVLIQLDRDLTLVFALGMTGRLLVESAAAPPTRHTHLRIPLAGSDWELRFHDPRRFGGLWLVRTTEVRPATALETGNGHRTPRALPLGDEPLTVTLPRFRRLLRRRRQIKALLLDQSVIAGLGNIYADEGLHRARIHPLRCADTLTDPEVATLRRALRVVLSAAIDADGSTLMDYRTPLGRPGSFQRQHRVYQRAGKPCKSCRTPIERIVAAGRTTHFCPRCQPRRVTGS